ncbi:hypothetical protein CC86DRAFT_370402 [Ophiobolus disseminans]|uniref:Uncharacterized protein n=1 Tax=Ophiobolus disseminans TaxID=1469910 RepID=A0A6A6ZZA2_9PLEO|nr:hypothetical protein CC86DRAFT_370402 [Ophiobolus disseminans]
MSRKPHCDNLPFEDLYFLPSSSSLARPATLHSSCNSPSSLPAYDSLGTQTDSYNMSPTSAADCPCAPCIKTRERCHRCKTTAAENSALLKKLEIYENKHAAKQERNTCFIITLLAFAFCFWVSTVAFTNHQGYMIVSWMALGPVSDDTSRETKHS